MLNREKYMDEIIKYALSGKEGIALRNGKIVSCNDDQCQKCDCYKEPCEEYIMKWLNSEYEGTTVDWSKVPVDTPILVRDSENEKWYKKHFAKYDNGIYAWQNGATSWSADSESLPWNYAKLAEDADFPQVNSPWHNLKDLKPEDRQEVIVWDGRGIYEDRWSDDADYFEYADAEEIWWMAMPEPPTKGESHE